MKNQLDHKTVKFAKMDAVLLFSGIVLIAFNLRPAITSVGPLMGMIRDDIGFSNWNVAFLTSLPLIAFAMMSPIIPRLANRIANEWMLVIGLFMLTVGIGLRSISIVLFLFIGTLCIGLGVAICNVLLPSVIKGKFPHKVAIMTSIYTTGMGIFATTASGLSIPLANGLQLGWQLSLSVWGIPSVIGLLLWFLIARKSKNRPTSQIRYLEKQQNSGIWKSNLAWKVALFMGMQSLIFYVTISWLAEILIDFGMGQATAGFMVSYVQFIGIPVSFMIPILAVRWKSQSILVCSVNLLYIIGILLLLMRPSFALIIVAVGCIGIASSSNFAMALTFLSIRAKNAKDAADLSGMAQSVGYILAAFGPIIIGYLYDVTAGWTIPLVSLIFIAAAIIFFGVQAGQNKYVLEN